MTRFGSFRLSCQGLFSTRDVLAHKSLQTSLQAIRLCWPIKEEETNARLGSDKGLPRRHRATASGRPNSANL